MTLIAALRCREGVVFCSDSQQTRGLPGRRLARPAQKLYEPRPGFLFAAAGAQDVAQELALRLRGTEAISPNDDRLQLKARLQEILRELRSDPGIEGRADHVEFLIAWWASGERKPVVLHLRGAGAAEWVDDWAFGGMPLAVDLASFALSTLRYLDASALPLAQTKLVVLKVLRDTIETSVEGVGGAVQMATLEQGRVRVLAEADLRSLHDAVDLWEAACAELLGVYVPRSAASAADRPVARRR